MTKTKMDITRIEKINIRCPECSTEIEVPFHEEFKVERCPQCTTGLNPMSKKIINDFKQNLKDMGSGVNLSFISSVED